MRITLLAILLVASVAAAPSTQPATWKAIHGTVLHDAKRNKDLPVTLFIPNAPGPHPLIVFSHGAGGSGENYGALVTGWAQRGYVVISPTHADSIALKTPAERRGLRPRDVVLNAVTDVKGWQERPRDVTFVLDSLDELERRVPELAGKVDRERIGVAGHSYGAMTATIIAGATIRTKPGGELLSLADPRVKAAVVLSGQGEGQMGFVPESWATLKIPLMVMTGSEDRGAMRQDPRWRKAPFEHSPAGEKYWIYITGATHMSFTGRTVAGEAGRGLFLPGDERTVEQEKPIFAVIEQATGAFWDAQLKGDADAKKLLQSDHIASDAAVKVEYETR
jgi:predicted dienelactone hydrolase